MLLCRVSLAIVLRVTAVPRQARCGLTTSHPDAPAAAADIACQDRRKLPPLPADEACARRRGRPT